MSHGSTTDVPRWMDENGTSHGCTNDVPGWADEIGTSHGCVMDVVCPLGWFRVLKISPQPIVFYT